MHADHAGDIVIAAATDGLATDLSHLAAEARSEGINNVATLVERWLDESERYDEPGESMLVAWSGNIAIGVGGLARCPDVVGALRVRRFYVSPSFRRRGIAGHLADALITSGLEHTDVLSCNARASAAAAPFWESMGFEPVDFEGITHCFDR